jgi:hypothetical protein
MSTCRSTPRRSSPSCEWRSSYVAALESFIGTNAGRITTLKWEVESIAETSDDYSVVAVELVRDDGQTVSMGSLHTIENDEVNIDCYSNPTELAELISKLQYTGVDDDEINDAVFAKWAGVPASIGLTLGEAVFGWVLAQPDLAATSSIKTSELQVS